MSDYVSFSEALLNLLQPLALTDAPTEMIGFAHVTCIILEPTTFLVLASFVVILIFYSVLAGSLST